MNKIISTTGSPIEFDINKDRHLLIDIRNEIEVTDAELAILNERLGNQIKVTVPSNPTAPVTPVLGSACTLADGTPGTYQADPAEVTAPLICVAPAPIVAPTEPVAPALVSYTVLAVDGITEEDGTVVAQNDTVELDPTDATTIAFLADGSIELTPTA